MSTKRGPQIRYKIETAKASYRKGLISYSELLKIAKEACREMERIQIDKFGKVRNKFSPQYILR